MSDLSHWNMAAHFSIREIACIFCGFEPSDSINDPKVNSIEALLNKAYLKSRELCELVLEQKKIDLSNGVISATTTVPFDTAEEWRALPSQDLRSSFAAALKNPETHSLIPTHLDKMRFNRDEIEIFLDESKFIPEVRLSQHIRKEGEVKNPFEFIEDTIDPSDFPHELDAANIAFTAVSKGYGDQNITFKKRLIEYLERNFKGFSSQAIQRIATVANPDKSTGRQKSSKE